MMRRRELDFCACVAAGIYVMEVRIRGSRRNRDRAALHPYLGPFVAAGLPIVVDWQRFGRGSALGAVSSWRWALHDMVVETVLYADAACVSKWRAVAWRWTWIWDQSDCAVNPAHGLCRGSGGMCRARVSVRYARAEALPAGITARLDRVGAGGPRTRDLLHRHATSVFHMGSGVGGIGMYDSHGAPAAHRLRLTSSRSRHRRLAACVLPHVGRSAPALAAFLHIPRCCGLPRGRFGR